MLLVSSHSVRVHRRMNTRPMPAREGHALRVAVKHAGQCGSHLYLKSISYELPARRATGQAFSAVASTPAPTHSLGTTQTALA